MTKAKVVNLSVRLHNQEIGAITYVGTERTLFSFTQDYIRDPNRPTLGLRFKDQFGELITDFRPYKVKLMPFLLQPASRGLSAHLPGAKGRCSRRP